jgi:FG-GAP-like repeat
MRPLTRGMIDRNRRLVFGAPCPRVFTVRLLAALVGATPFALGACTGDPVGVEFHTPGVGGSGETPIPIDEPGLIEQCGADGIKCGDEGCCTSGNVCSTFGRCIPDKACKTSEDCSADSMCASNRCQPWDVLPDGFRFAQSCRTAVDLPSVVPTVQCQWPGATAPAIQPEMVQVIGTPMVVDFNSDDDPKTSHPSIVFISYAGAFRNNTGVIRVIDGQTCELQDTIPGQFPFTPQVPLALGDINGDGRPDIVAADEEPFGAATSSGVAIFELTGSGPVPKFKPMARGRIRSSGTGTITGFALHDVDGDNRPEIFTEKTMLRYDDVQGLQNASALQPTSTPVRPELSSIEPPTVIDIDGDHIPEVITPQGVFSWDTVNNVFTDKYRVGTVPLWNPGPDDAQGAFMASANLGTFPTGLPQGKDSAELVIIGHNGDVWVKRVDGGVEFTMSVAGLAGGPPVIADIDGDGRMEFASGGTDTLTVFDLDCTPGAFNQSGCGGGRVAQRADGVVWKARTQGATSGVAVFDFNGDGKAEVVYADQCFMRVYDGLTGSVLFSTPRMSTTQWEYPVVADTDGDGFSELVTASNDNDASLTCPDVDPFNDNAQVEFKPTHGVTVWREQKDRWAGSRPIWNQHNYFVTNVRDDGTIPSMAQVQSHWAPGGPNSFRENVQGATGRSLSLADVTTAGVSTFDCKPGLGLATVHVDLCNRGASALRPDETAIAMVNPAERTNILCQQRNKEAIDPGQCVVVDCDVPAPPRGEPFDLQILGDPSNQVSECNENNNVSIISHVSCVADVPR